MAGTPIDTNAAWSARPYAAALLRASTLLVPVAASVAFVYVGARLVPPPASSLALYLCWWLCLSFLATLVLLAVGKVSRRLLPLATLLKLSLAFPDATPSRFRTAVGTRTVGTLAERLADARQHDATQEEAGRRLLALVAALDDHDSLTRGHSERVRAYAQLIGVELGLSKHDLDLLNWAALLHDIGKLEIPQAILGQTGRPTEEEWATIRMHPELGATLVAPLADWLGDWSRAVLDHHERWDGAGYPSGIGGSEISLAGRIVAVADVFDVITSTRSYKQSSTMAEARKEIARCAGTQFDPEVVRAFLAVSLGRTRLVAGPGAWLAQAAVLARIPLTSAAGTLSAAAVVGVSVVPGGVVERNAPQPEIPSPRARATVTVPTAPTPTSEVSGRPRVSGDAEAPPAQANAPRSRPQPVPTPGGAEPPEPAPPPTDGSRPVVVPPNSAAPAPTAPPPTSSAPPARQPSSPAPPSAPAPSSPPSPPPEPPAPTPPPPPEPPSPPPEPPPPPAPVPPPAPAPPPVPPPPAVPSPPPVPQPPAIPTIG